MKIGMMADMYKPYISGVTNHIEITSKAMANAGHKVVIFTFGGTNLIDQEETVVRSKGITINFPSMDLPFELAYNHSAEAINLLKQMDILHVHHPFRSGKIACSVSDSQNIPVVFTSHTRYDLHAEVYFPFINKELVWFTLENVLKKSCSKFDAIITPSMSSMKMYKSMGIEGNFIHIPNGIQLDHIRETQEPVDRNTLGFSSENFIVIYVGRVGPEKNLPVCIESFMQLIKRRPRIRLVIVGRGTELDNLQRQTARLGLCDFVRFTGFVPYSEVPKYLRMADAFLTASTTEIHPLSVLEALASGLPVVGVDAGGVGDIIQHGETGLLSQNDVTEITQNLIKLIDNRDLLVSLGRNAETAAQQFDIKRTHKLLLETYQELIEQKRVEKIKA
jgi:1,2-diacylglycerol 3-alpha-glucosyltransferase